jgi:hypothetical protein
MGAFRPERIARWCNSDTGRSAAVDRLTDPRRSLPGLTEKGKGSVERPTEPVNGEISVERDDATEAQPLHHVKTGAIDDRKVLGVEPSSDSPRLRQPRPPARPDQQPPAF